MTTNAPERIWAATPADGVMKPETMYGWTTEEHVEEWRLDNQAEIDLGCDDPLAYVEYIRADLSPSPEVVKELVDLVRDVAAGNLDVSHTALCFGYPEAQAIQNRANAILAKLEGGK